MLEPPLSAALELVARRPMLPLEYMARLLQQDRDELRVRLDVAARLGWLTAEKVCCGREDRYSVTALGLAVL